MFGRRGIPRRSLGQAVKESTTDSAGSRQARRGMGFAGRNRVSGSVDQHRPQDRPQEAARNLTFQGLLVSGTSWLVYTLGSAIGRALAGKLESAIVGHGDDLEQRKSEMAPKSKQQEENNS